MIVNRVVIRGSSSSQAAVSGKSVVTFIVSFDCSAVRCRVYCFNDMCFARGVQVSVSDRIKIYYQSVVRVSLYLYEKME